MKNKVTFKEIIKRIFKRIKLRTLFLLAILLSCNTFAWFIYATRVSNNISAYVKSWKVNFIVGENNIEETLSFDIESIYPGMEDTNQVITAQNDSDLSANLSYEIVSATIFGETISTDTMTPTEIEEYIANTYPFKLTIQVENGNMTANGGRDNISFRFSWPYESGDDELDTKWGYKAYQYKEENPDSKSIILVIKVMATQSSSEG